MARALVAAVALPAALVGASRDARAQGPVGASRDAPGQVKAPVDGPPASRWHGSTVLLDQSATTQTVGVGPDYQSADPTYEWWLAVKPQYYLHETAARSLRLGLWMNATVEVTNSDTTTRAREVLLGPTYLSMVYGQTLRERDGYRTAVSVGPRLTLPTEKAAWSSGQLIGLGATGDISQSFPLHGKQARTLNGARVSLGFTYNHAVDRATSPVSDGIRELRQDVAGRPIVSDLLRGQMNVHDSLTVLATGSLQITPRLDLALSYVVGNSWLYTPPDACVATLTGCVTPMTATDPTAYRVSTWVTASVGYQLWKAVGLNVGYYNRASQLGPDGTRRNPLWSPSARFFLTLIGSLDGLSGG